MFQVSGTCHVFLVETRQSGFAEFSEMQSIFDFSEIKNRKRIAMVLGPKSKSKIFNCFETIYKQAYVNIADFGLKK